MVLVPEQDTDDVCESKIKVFLRLRPLNKLETSKRAKDCIELHEDPSKISIDAPLQGLFDFSLEHVFDEHATQADVYNDSGLSEIPTKLLSGIDCTVMAYGQTGTGKTHLLCGSISRLGRELDDDNDNKNKNNNNYNYDDELKGIIPFIVVDLLGAIQNNLSASIECIVKISIVELYLERWIDLLYPASEVWVDSNSQIQGASELCCLHLHDVYRALLRASLHRTQSSTYQNHNAACSHLIFQIRVEQIDRTNNIVRSATLRMVDLAGSEQATIRSSRQVNSPLALEKRMISASLQGLHSYVRTRIAIQEGNTTKNRILRSDIAGKFNKLIRLLKSSLDGPSYTMVFLTASPSSYSIGETLNTLNFGAKLRLLSLKPTHPRLNTLSIREFPSLMKQSKRRIENLTHFVKLLAVECRIVRKTGKIKQPHAVWDVISRIAKSSNDTDSDLSGLLIAMTRTEDESKSIEEGEMTMDHAKLLLKCHDAEVAKEKAESCVRDYQSTITSLRAEAELLKKENNKLKEELETSKDQLEKLNTANIEISDRLRTSQFREQEAVVFLRQFRTFYLRLLRSKVSQGSGDPYIIVNDVGHQIPGVAGLKDMIDVDRLLIQSGLIESVELGEDTNDADYRPSLEAVQMSQLEAVQAEQKREQIVFNELGRTNETGGVATEYRQKMVESPSGRLAVQNAKELECSLIELSNKYMSLQKELTVEKAMVEALSARQGALGKMKAAQEINAIKSEMERRTNDLQAIIWKMNELHLVNKTVYEKFENRESHIVYLEEHLTTLHHKYQQLFFERQQANKKLREENLEMKARLESATVKLWQLGEETPNNPFKLIIPVSGKAISIEQADRRISLGDIAEEGIEILGDLGENQNEVSVATQTDPEAIVTVIEVEIQTDDIVLDIDDAAVQTDPVQVLEIELLNAQCTEESSVASVKSCATESNVRDKGESKEIGVQTIGELHFDIGVQTEENLQLGEQLFPEHSVATHDNAEAVKWSMVDIGIQTDQLHTTICFEAGTQTEDPPESDVMISESNLHDSSGSLDEDELFQKPTRPPKPPMNDRSSRVGNGHNKVEDAGNMSQNSLSSLGSISGLACQPERLGSSMKWNTTVGSKFHHSDGRLGVSMSSLQIQAPKTTDWRTKLRIKADGTSTSVSSANHGNNRSIISQAPVKQSSKRDIFTIDSNVPEWITKFKEMGIKTEEMDPSNEHNPNVAEQAKVIRPIHPCLEKPSIPSSPPTEKPQWMQKLKSPKVSDVEDSLPVAPWVKHMRRSTSRELHSKDSDGAAPKSQRDSMQQSNSIGVDEHDDLLVQQDQVDDVNNAEGVNRGTPEWMLKFKQIGQKGEEKVI